MSAQRVGKTWIVAGEAVAGRLPEPSGPGWPVSAPAARSAVDRHQRYRARQLLAAALLPASGAGVPLAVALVGIVASADVRSRYLARIALEKALGEAAP